MPVAGRGFEENTMTKRQKRAVGLPLLAGALALILWITLFSRFGSDVRAVYMPFWSYRKIARGDYSLLLEDFENILLFVPVGLFTCWILQRKLPGAVAAGFAFSVLIEVVQWIFWLGSFEFDDLLHNTLGALVGAVFARYTSLGKRWGRIFQKKDLRWISLLVAVLLMFPLCGQWAHRQSMKRFAALSPSPDGRSNLLVVDGKDGVFDETDVSVSYQRDGRVKLSGRAEKRSWFLLGKVTLPKGTYRFSGFCETPEAPFDIVLEYLDRESGRFLCIASVKTAKDIVFSLDKKTRIRVLAGVFPGTDGTVFCRPAIYREE